MYVRTDVIYFQFDKEKHDLNVYKRMGEFYNKFFSINGMAYVRQVTHGIVGLYPLVGSDG